MTNKKYRRPLTAQAVKLRLQKFAANLVLAILLLGLCFLILQPLFNKIAVSFMSEQDLYDSTVVTIPRHFTLDNYRVALKLMDYGRSFVSTFVLAVAVAVLQVVSCLLVGYGFARYDFPLKKLWFFMVILLIVVPSQTYISTCTGLKCGLYIYLFRQYFRNIPKDIEEAAYLDGCGTLRTLFHIMLPDAMPLATSCFLFSFVWQWTDNYFSTLLTKSSHLLPARLNALASNLISYLAPLRPSATYSAALNATGTLLLLLPVLVLYLFAQKRFVQSLTAGGIKM